MHPRQAGVSQAAGKSNVNAEKNFLKSKVFEHRKRFIEPIVLKPVGFPAEKREIGELASLFRVLDLLMSLDLREPSLAYASFVSGRFPQTVRALRGSLPFPTPKPVLSGCME
jgi:hypothetical protein